MRFISKGTLCAMAATAAFVSSSQAQASISVSLWVDQAAAAGNATLAQAALLGAPSATTTLPLLNFSTGNSAATTIDAFLSSSIGGTIGTHLLNNTYFLFTGSTFLNAGSNAFSIPHDDGLQLNITGIGLVVDAPGEQHRAINLEGFVARPLAETRVHCRSGAALHRPACAGRW